jgi:uncharacterized protein involved in outer membrane biogenesis
VSKRGWWLGGLGLVIILPAAALGTAIFVLDPNDYKPQLQDAVQEATGRALTLGGPLRISRSLWPTIEVNDVQLANLPGGSRADMARAERIEAQLSLPALLWRRIEIIRLTLIGPNILFEQVGGKPNWVFDADQPAPAPTANRAEPRATLGFRDVHVQNGMVTFKLPARTKVVGIRSLDSRHPDDGGPLDIKSILVYSDYAPFTLNASAQPTGGLAAPWNTQLQFAAYDTTAAAKGTMALAGDYDLQLDGKSGALEKLNALLPPMQLPALHDMTVTAHLTNGPVRGDLPVIGQAKLHVGSVDLSDRVPGLSLGATDIALPKAGGLASIAGAGSYSGQAFTVGGNFGVPEHPDGRVSIPIDLTVTAKGKAAGSVAAKGKLGLNTGQFDGLDAAVALRAPALGAFAPLAALPAFTQVALDSQVVVPASLASLTLRGAKLSTHEAEIAGDATIGLGGAVAVDGKLQAARLDGTALMAIFGLDASPGRAKSGHVISDTDLSWTGLRGKTISLTASIAALDFARQAWRNLNLTVQLKNGRLQLGLPGAPLDAALTVDAASETPRISLAMHAPSLPLALIALPADLPGAIDGNVHIEAQLRAAGKSPHELAASLDGPFAATMVHGSLSNTALVELAAAALRALNIKVPPQGETTIHCLGLVGEFSKGVGRFKTIAVNSTYLELSGAGEVDLGQETLALKLHPLAQLTGSAVAVPVLVDGPFRALQGRLDASGLDKVGLLIDALFGGDNPKTCVDAGLVAPH